MFGKRNKCDRVREMLSPYIDGELKSADALEVEGHITECGSCRAELESLKSTVSLLQRAEKVSPRRSFTIAEPEAQWRAAPVRALTALRLATSAAALLLVAVIVSNAAGAFSGGSGEEVYLLGMENDCRWQSLSGASVNESKDGDPHFGHMTQNESDEEVYLAASISTIDNGGHVWPVRGIVIGLSGAVVVLAASTVFVWHRRVTADIAIENDNKATERKVR